MACSHPSDPLVRLAAADASKPVGTRPVSVPPGSGTRRTARPPSLPVREDPPGGSPSPQSPPSSSRSGLPASGSKSAGSRLASRAPEPCAGRSLRLPARAAAPRAATAEPGGRTGPARQLPGVDFLAGFSEQCRDTATSPRCGERPRGATGRGGAAGIPRTAGAPAGPRRRSRPPSEHLAIE